MARAAVGETPSATSGDSAPRCTAPAAGLIITVAVRDTGVTRGRAVAVAATNTAVGDEVRRGGVVAVRWSTGVAVGVVKGGKSVAVAAEVAVAVTRCRLSVFVAVVVLLVVVVLLLVSPLLGGGGGIGAGVGDAVANIAATHATATVMVVERRIAKPTGDGPEKTRQV